MSEIARVRLNRSDFWKIRQNIDKYKWKIIELDLSGAKTIIPGLDKMYFKPDGYVHGAKDPRAMSGWIVLPDGRKVMRAYLKYWLHTSPGPYVDRLLMGGVTIATGGRGRRKIALQVDVGIDHGNRKYWEENRANYEAEGARINQTLKQLYKPSPREAVVKRIKGYEEFGDYRQDQVGYWTYDYMFVPKRRARRLIWLLRGYTAQPYVASGDWNPRQTAEADKKMLNRLQEFGWRLGKTEYTVKKKVESYNRAMRGGEFQSNALLNVIEARLGMVKSILYQYRRTVRAHNKNRTKQ